MNISKEFLNYSEKTGTTGEIEFEKIARLKNFTVSHPTEEQNIYNHIDFFITKGGNTVSVDVKGLKQSVKTDEIWIEFKNVRGNRGWLYGDSDVIAFQLNEGFVLVNRKSLIELVESKTNMLAYSDKDNALYKLYSRAGRDDELTKIKINDLFETKHKKWY